MKYLIIIILTVLFIEKGFSQTTIEEYNFITTGFKLQIESGLDMKKGYQLKELCSLSTNERTAILKVLYRIDNKGVKSTAAYMIIYKKKDQPSEYLCIAHPNSDAQIQNALYKSLTKENENNSLKSALIIELLSKNLKW